MEDLAQPLCWKHIIKRPYPIVLGRSMFDYNLEIQWERVPTGTVSFYQFSLSCLYNVARVKLYVAYSQSPSIDHTYHGVRISFAKHHSNIIYLILLIHKVFLKPDKCNFLCSIQPNHASIKLFSSSIVCTHFFDCLITSAHGSVNFNIVDVSKQL